MAIRPLFKRSPKSPWLGLVISGALAAVICAMIAVVVGGIWATGSPLGMMGLTQVLGAMMGTLAFALLGAILVVPLWGWAQAVRRAKPWVALAVVHAPILQAAILVPFGLIPMLSEYASALFPLFLIQAWITWGLMLWLAYPGYEVSKKKSSRAPAKSGASLPQEPAD